MKLSFYRSGLIIRFDTVDSRRSETSLRRRIWTAGASFPDLTFLQLLFGWRSREEIQAGYPDCFTSGDEAGVLLDALFPKQPSQRGLSSKQVVSDSARVGWAKTPSRSAV